MSTTVPLIQTNINLNSYIVNNISFKKISLDITNKTLYLNVSINYTQQQTNGDTTITNKITNIVAPIYMYSDEFDNMINIQKLNNIIAGICGLQISTTLPPVSRYKYIPQANII